VIGMANDDATGRLLDALLWSLQAEPESQVRQLIRAHDELNAMRDSGEHAEGEAIAPIKADLAQVRDCTTTIRTLCDRSLQEAEALAPDPAMVGVSR
jgi:hypothetical protein